ncbi:exopolysaccharide biosynthesis protein [Paracoccus bogoriensis]|uniref:exopolysaccharide biosynthesis protein n=1 Tax=Paracoccus bogoriensis TaxID=242065 RepID=UPI001C66597A|nr:exopolysaccharide biosynthesis protein [Paracoccus bogoriensis]MBW7056177.1 exopolysaccharide biosynthesis protein [Paracoccus bogoriensis]
MHHDETITGLMGRVQAVAEKGERTCLRDVIDSLGRDSFIPQLMIPALAVVSPLSGVPLFSSLCGITIALVSAQMLAQRQRIWLPRWLLEKEIDSKRLLSAATRMKRPAGWLDRITRNRLRVLVWPPVLWIAQALCLACGLMMPFLELVPFTSSILGTVVLLLSFGMLARDGLFTLLGFVMIGGLGIGVTVFVNGSTV